MYEKYIIRILKNIYIKYKKKFAKHLSIYNVGIYSCIFFKQNT